MAEENGKENRDRKVIPYDEAFGAQNANLTDPTMEEDGGDSWFRDVMAPPENDDREINSPLESTEPIGWNDRDPKDIRTERGDIEAAEEVTEPLPRRQDEQQTEGTNEGNGLGITGLILSLVSIFIWPAVLGPAGMIVGFFAWRRGARTTGIWAMVIGAFALLMALLILPAYFRL